MDEKSTPIVFYSECTIAMTPYEKYVVGPIQSSTRTINDISTSTPVKGEGEVSWEFVDDYEVT